MILSKNQMIHKNCKKIKKIFCYDFENKCIKWFFEKKLMMTNLCYHSNFSRYRRFSCEFVEKKILKQQMNNFLQFLIVAKIWNSYQRWNLYQYEIRKIFVQIYFQKKNDHVDIFFNFITIRSINDVMIICLQKLID